MVQSVFRVSISFSSPHWPIRKLAVVGQHARYTPLKKCIQAVEAWSFRQYGSVFRQCMNWDDFQVVSHMGSIAVSKAWTSDSGKWLVGGGKDSWCCTAQTVPYPSRAIIDTTQHYALLLPHAQNKELSTSSRPGQSPSFRRETRRSYCRNDPVKYDLELWKFYGNIPRLSTW